jgi:hypothetical protein
VGREGEQLAPGTLARHGAILVVVGALLVPVEAVAVVAGARLVPHRRVTGVLIVLAAAVVAAVRLVLLPHGDVPEGASEAYRDGYRVGVLTYWATGLALTAVLAWHYAAITVSPHPRAAAAPRPEAPALWRRVAAWLLNLTLAIALGIAVAALVALLGAPDAVVALVLLGGSLAGLLAIALVARARLLDPTPGHRLVGVRIDRGAQRAAAVRAANYRFRSTLSAAALVVPAGLVVALALGVAVGSGRDPEADAAAEYRRGMIAGCTKNGWSNDQCTCLADRVLAESLLAEMEATFAQLQRDPRSPISEPVRAVLVDCGFAEG